MVIAWLNSSAACFSSSSGDVHVGGALEHLRKDDVGDDRLIFATQIAVQFVDQMAAADRRFRVVRGFVAGGARFVASE